MPLFEYRCSACAHLEEVLQKHGEPPPPECPKCHKAGTFAKEMSRTSFQLKGGGWYKDLYASSKSGTSSDGASSESSSASSSTPATQAASAPAATSPAAASPAASTSSSAAPSTAPAVKAPSTPAST